jgi:hypothetical protein
MTEMLLEILTDMQALGRALGTGLLNRKRPLAKVESHGVETTPSFDLTWTPLKRPFRHTGGPETTKPEEAMQFLSPTAVPAHGVSD